MKSTGVIRRVDILGRAVIPKNLRDGKKYSPGTEISFSIEGDQILLNRYMRTCMFCSNKENISMFNRNLNYKVNFYIWQLHI